MRLLRRGREMAMDCRRIREKIELFVLDGLSPEEKLQVTEHVRNCCTCREEVEQYRRLVGKIARGTQGEQLGEEEVLRLQAACRRAVREEIRRRARLRTLRNLVAALFLIATLGFVFRLSRVRKEPPPLMHESWSYRGVSAMPASPADQVVVSGTRLYLLRKKDGETCVAAVDIESGSELWRSQCKPLGYLAADADRVFCLTGGPGEEIYLTALGGDDGKVIWMVGGRSKRPVWGLCRPVVLQSALVCWTDGPEVRLFDSQTGRELWTVDLGEDGPLSRAVPDREGLFVAGRKNLYCLEARTGGELWRIDYGNGVFGRDRPLAAAWAGRVFVARKRPDFQAELVCIDARQRKILWRRPVPPVRFLLAALDGVFLRAAGIIALDRYTGHTLWRYPASGCGPLAVIEGLLHFADSTGTGRLLALDPRTGRKVWCIEGLRSCDVLKKSGTMGCIRTRDGAVHAFTIAARSFR